MAPQPVTSLHVIILAPAPASIQQPIALPVRLPHIGNKSEALAPALLATMMTDLLTPVQLAHRHASLAQEQHRLALLVQEPHISVSLVHKLASARLDILILVLIFVLIVIISAQPVHHKVITV